MPLFRVFHRPIVWRLCVGASLVLSIALVLRSLSLGFQLVRPIPYWDQWEFVRSLPHLYDHTYSWQNLFGQHNEHRIVTARLIFISDYLWFDGAGYFTTIILYAALFAIAIIFSVVTTHLAYLRYVHFAVILGFMLSVSQWENLSSGFQVQFPFVDLFIIGSVGCLILALDTHHRHRRLAFAMSGIGLDVLAVFSMASGVLAIVPALFVGLAIQPRAKTLHLYVLAHLVICAIFFIGYSRNSGIVPTYDPIAIVMYVLIYLGSCLRGYELLPLLLGLADLALMGYAMIRLGTAIRHRQRLDRVQLFAVSIALAVVAGAFATANGRASLGLPSALASRYSLQSILMQIALFTFCWRMIEHGSARRVDHNAARAILLASLSILSLASNVSALSLDEWQDRIVNDDTAGAAMANGVFSDNLVKLVYQTPSRIQASIRFLANQRKSLFSPGIAEMYRPALNALVGWDRADSEQCMAQFSATRAGPTWMELDGWVFSKSNPASGGTIVVLDRNDHDRIVGYGFQSLRRPDVDAALHVSVGRSGFLIGLNSPLLAGEGPHIFTVVLIPSRNNQAICQATIASP